jgi:hypothetical protein
VDRVLHEVTRNATPTSAKIAAWADEHSIEVQATCTFAHDRAALIFPGGPRRDRLVAGVYPAGQGIAEGGAGCGARAAAIDRAWRQGSVAGMTEIPGYLRVVIRADASIEMGSGHVMRCLTLADALRERGADVHFICRDLPGHPALLQGRLIRERRPAADPQDRRCRQADDYLHRHGHGGGTGRDGARRPRSRLPGPHSAEMHQHLPRQPGEH